MYLWPQKFNGYIIGGVVLTAGGSGSTGSMCFLGILKLDPDPLVRGMDPDPDLHPSNIKQK
jgi:hypothetical protein